MFKGGMLACLQTNFPVLISKEHDVSSVICPYTTSAGCHVKKLTFRFISKVVLSVTLTNLLQDGHKGGTGL
jgi:hypothetical protein